MAKILMVIILLLQFLEAAQETLHGTVIVNGMAELKCNFNNPDNISRESLIIYWQRKVEVVYTLVSGKEMNFVDKNYVNNTKVLLSNYDLRLYNISLEQSGEYDCIVSEQQMWGKKKIYGSKFQLNVLANFSVPEISSESSLVELEPGITVSLKCSSGHGFPKPKSMFWQLTDGNGTKEPRYPLDEVKNIGETFNISISWRLTVEEDINVTCGLEAHHKAVSPVLQLKVKKPPVPPESDLKITIAIIISVVVLVLGSALSIILIWKQSRPRVPRSRDQEMGSSGAESKNTVSPENCTLMPTEHETTTG